jgi:hypothetical protein
MAGRRQGEPLLRWLQMSSEENAIACGSLALVVASRECVERCASTHVATGAAIFSVAPASPPQYTDENGGSLTTEHAACDDSQAVHLETAHIILMAYVVMLIMLIIGQRLSPP